MNTGLGRALRAEMLKLRRTRALWLALVAPLAIVVLYTLVILAGGNDPSAIGWSRTAMTMLVLWSTLMFPLYVALLTALIHAVDHDARAQKHLFVQPAPRWSLHAAKLGAAFALAALSSVVLAAGIIAMVVALKAAGYGAGGGPTPTLPILKATASVYAGGLLVIALHHALSQRLRGFEWPLALGIVATIAATVIMQSPDYWMYCPWAYPATAALANDASANALAMAGSACGAALVSLLAAWDVERRDVAA